MKVLLVLALAVASATSEAPRFGRFKAGGQRATGFARQEVATSAAEAGGYPPAPDYGAPSAQEGPYPPSGWKPAGERLRLPARQEAAPPTDEYGTPAYLPPSAGYGAPLVNEPAAEPEAELIDDRLTRARLTAAPARSGKLVAQSNRLVKQQRLVAQPQTNLLVQQQRLVAPVPVALPQVQYYQSLQVPLVSSAPLAYPSQYYYTF